jgi:hypothetical protein
MDYPRGGMIDFLKLLSGSLVGLFRSHAAREAEVAFLRHQVLVLRRSAPATLRLQNADRLIFVCWGGRPHGIACQNWGCEQPRPEPSMTQYKRIGIDTSKAVFTLHGIDQEDRPTLRINLRRAQMIPFFRT